MKAFLSYSRQDSEWVRGAGLKDINAPPLMEWVKEQLAQIGVELWIDTHLEEHIGEDFEQDIQKRLMESDLAIVLVSQDYITSKFIAAKEMNVIRQRVESGEMRIFPIIVSTIIWEHNEMAEWISRFQVYPARTRTLQNEISGLRDLKVHRTEILRLIKKLMADRGVGASGKATVTQPAAKPGMPAISFQPSGPRQTPGKGLIIGGIAFFLLLMVTVLFLHFHSGQHAGSSDPNVPGVSLPVPSLGDESKNLDIPPAIYGSRVVLDWTAFSVPDTDKFEVQVAQSQSFLDQETFTKETAQDSLVLERAQKNSKLLGRLYWRVRIARKQGLNTFTGPWSEVGAFDIYDSALSRIVLTQTLIVGTSAIENQPGDTIRSAGGGKYEGLDADIIAQVVLRLKSKLATPNLTVRFINMPWKDLLPVLAQNQVDIAISGISATEAREREYGVKFSRPYYSSAQVAMALKSSGIATLADALKRKAYSIEGRAGSSVAQAVFADNEVVKGATHYAKLFEVLRDHPDAVVIHDYAMLYSQAVAIGAADQYVFLPIVSDDLPEEKRRAFLEAHNRIDCDQWGIAVADSQVELLNEINDCIDWLDAQGTLAQLIVHHNYPESSLQNCEVTVETLHAQTAPETDLKPTQIQPPAPAPAPAPAPGASQPAPNQKPQVETVPF